MKGPILVEASAYRGIRRPARMRREFPDLESALVALNGFFLRNRAATTVVARVNEKEQKR